MADAVAAAAAAGVVSSVLVSSSPCAVKAPGQGVARRRWRVELRRYGRWPDGAGDASSVSVPPAVPRPNVKAGAGRAPSEAVGAGVGDLNLWRGWMD